MTFYIGLMSGTSMDGIDAALVDVETHTLIHGMTKAYSPFLKNQLKTLNASKSVQIATFCQANTLVGEAFADACNALLQGAGVQSSQVRAIGSHGQTLTHDISAQPPYTLQIGCGHTIAERTGITVVADFRTRDLILGGQGAPFAPLYHQIVFPSHTAVVNIGGIANITVLSADQTTIGWDVGPGNCLMDAWINKHLLKSYDQDGTWAKQGKVIPELLKALQTDAFFALSPPKSLGKEYYALSWLESYLLEHYQPQDVQATLLMLTAWGIARAVPSTVNTLLICGGGVHNNALFSVIQALLPDKLVQSTDEVGISADYLEAMLFAWLASQTLQNIPVDLSTITGSKQPLLLGAIYPINMLC